VILFSVMLAICDPEARLMPWLIAALVVIVFLYAVVFVSPLRYIP